MSVLHARPALLAMVCISLPLPGCLRAGPDLAQSAARDAWADQSLAVLREVQGSLTGIGELRAQLTGVEHLQTEVAAVKQTVGDISAGGDLNDTWTLRLLVLSLALSPLTGYLAPKLLWQATRRRLRQRRLRLRPIPDRNLEILPLHDPPSAAEASAPRRVAPDG